MIKVAHLTSVHSRFDVRIFIKQCRSLAANAYDVTLVVADNLGDDRKDGIEIMDVARLSVRLDRMVRTTYRIFRKAVALDADIYHLHDPELIPIGLKLKLLGKKVVFDAHEDLPRQLLSKPYLTPISLQFLSKLFSLFERYACRCFDGIVAATPSICDKFLAINPNTVNINNFPIIGELESTVPWTEKREEVCYVGAIEAIRGIRELVHACELLQSSARLNLAGCFSETALEAEVKGYPGWMKVNELGFLDRASVRDLLTRSLAGLVTFLPLPNHTDAQPNKMFEYMSAGIPVIASNFPLWRNIIEGNHCGICVDPLSPEAIASAIDFLINDPEHANQMGENGRISVHSRYNWFIEEKKLLTLYETL